MNYKEELEKIEGAALVSVYADHLLTMTRGQLENLIWKYALKETLRADVTA